jgi:hypothetical protein
MFEVHGWTLNHETQALVEMAMQTEDMPSRLRAIAMLRQLRRDALESAGVLVTARETRTTGPDGNTQTQTTLETVVQRVQDIAGMDFEDRGEGVDLDPEPEEEKHAEPA